MAELASIKLQEGVHNISGARTSESAADGREARGHTRAVLTLTSVCRCFQDVGLKQNVWGVWWYKVLCRISIAVLSLNAYGSDKVSALDATI